MLTPNLELLQSLAYAAANTVTTHQSNFDSLSLLSETFTSLAGFSLAEAFRSNETKTLRRDALLLIVQNFIRSHLADAELTPEKIASADHMSQRTLFALFASAGLSVMDWLWSERLAHAHGLLSNASLAHVTNAEIAYASCFRNASHFSTRFKKAFGLTPTDYRQQALQQSA